jgi:phage gp45-like
MATSVKLQGTALYQDTTAAVNLATDNTVAFPLTTLSAVTASLTGDMQVQGNANVSGSLHIAGDLDVAGAINSVTKTTSILEVEDINIICASGSNSSAADEAGLLIGGHALADSVAGFTWDDGASSIQFSIAGSNEALMSATAFSPAAADGMALGSATLEWSDLFLADAATVKFGADQDVTLTHVPDTGLLLNGSMQLQFNDASQNINAPSATVLDINATDEVEINATLCDVNANLDVSGTYTGGGLMTVGGSVVIPDDGNIGSASDANAISISAAGKVTLTATTEASAIGTGCFVASGGASIAKDLYVGDDLELDSDACKLGFGADSDVSLTHVPDTGLLLNSSRQLQFGDNGTYIHQSADGVLDLVADTEIEINATTIDMNGALDLSGNATVGGRVIVDDTTEATTTADGSLQTDGGLSVATDAVFGNDVKMLSDAAVLNMGADSDVSLTHVADTGLLLNSSRQLQFGDNGTYIHQSADGVLDLVADTEIEINATTIDMNGAIDASSTITAAGRVIVDDTTEATTTTDGSLQTDGGLSVAKSAVIGDDLDLLSNGAVFKVGSDQPFTMTHANSSNTLTVTSGHKLAFGNASSNISYSSVTSGLMIADDGPATIAVGTNLTLTVPTALIINDGSNTANLNINGGGTSYAINLPNTAGGDAVARSWITHSDKTMKEGITNLDSDEILNKVLSLQGCTYKYKSGSDQEIGFLAQDMQKVFPEFVYGQHLEEGKLGIDYSKIASVLVESIKAQQGQIEDLKSVVVKLSENN